MNSKVFRILLTLFALVTVVLGACAPAPAIQAPAAPAVTEAPAQKAAPSCPTKSS